MTFVITIKVVLARDKTLTVVEQYSKGNDKHTTSDYLEN
jgi:hypothetical protein